MPCRCLQTPAPLDSAPGRPSSAFSGAALPRDLSPVAAHRRLTRPFPPGRTISDQRSRLDLKPIKPDPSDRDPTAEIRGYPFGLAFLLKNPLSLVESTRTPSLFKSIYRTAKNLAQTPLNFLVFEPAVQPLPFRELDPRSNP